MEIIIKKELVNEVMDIGKGLVDTIIEHGIWSADKREEFDKDGLKEYHSKSGDITINDHAYSIRINDEFIIDTMKVCMKFAHVIVSTYAAFHSIWGAMNIKAELTKMKDKWEDPAEYIIFNYMDDFHVLVKKQCDRFHVIGTKGGIFVDTAKIRKEAKKDLDNGRNFLFEEKAKFNKLSDAEEYFSKVSKE